MAGSNKRKKKLQPEPELPELKALNWYQQVLKDVRDVSIRPPLSKAEAMKYFQERYPRNWNYELSQRLQPFLPMTKSGQMQSIKNIERRHQARGGRGIPGTTARTEAQYAALGVSIGWEAPKYGYHIHYEGWVLFSNLCSYRVFDVDIVNDWSKQVVATPDLVFKAMFLLYMEEDDQDREIEEQEPSVGFCEEGDTGEAGESVRDPRITITANEQEKHSGHGGRARRFSFFDKR